MKCPFRKIVLLCLLAVGLGCSVLLIRQQQPAASAEPSVRRLESEEAKVINDWQRSISIERRPTYTPTDSADEKKPKEGPN